MEISVKAGNIAHAKAGAVVVTYFQDRKKLTPDLAAVDEALNKIISGMIKSGQITGKAGETTVVHSLGNLPAEMVAVIGLGKETELTLDKIRGAVGEVCRTLRQRRAATIALPVLGAGVAGLRTEDIAQATAEGVMMGLYVFHKHRSTKPELPELDEVTIIGEAVDTAALKQGIATGKVIGEAVNIARDMVNEPSNYMMPKHMVNEAEGIAAVAAAHGSPIKLEVFEREDMARLGMGALLGVAQGSDEPPKFMVLTYKGRGGADTDLALVGKAITFDSGGISIKPSEKMEEMKGDMAGGAAVLAAISVIAQLKLKVNVTAVVPSTENLPSGKAYKPGDVLKAMNGKTIEVISTDAEGRLALADALSYVVANIKPLHIVDVATLTGACVVALGNVTAAVFSTDQKLSDKILAAADRAGERFWQMPLFEEYKEQNKSEVADVKNTGGRAGGAITAALFLAEFAGDTSWAHLDIAGVDFTEKERKYFIKGATGIPVRTLVELAKDLAKD
jgi:leucyl aminopeptidase